MILQQIEFARNVALLINFIFSSGYYCTLGEAFRTKEQALINAQRHIGILDSQHRDRLAIDLNLFSQKREYLNKSEDYLLIGKYWESLSKFNKWGGRSKKLPDGNHFEMKDPV